MHVGYQKGYHWSTIQGNKGIIGLLKKQKVIYQGGQFLDTRITINLSAY
jgi:hypothetical protein